MDELRRQRVEIERSVRRIGEAFASGLDRQALLAIVVETAVGACGADYGLVALSGHVGAEAEAGKPTEAVQERGAGRREPGAARAGARRGRRRAASHAFASSLGRIGATGDAGGRDDDRPGGASRSPPAEREVFLYLVGQAAASVENIALHELVSEQAVTDELTGLANNRAFRELIEKEAARAERFGHELSLLMLDIDDFKQVNDTYGHLQGDEVLRAVGRVLQRRVARDRRAGALRRRGVRGRACRRPSPRARSSSRSGSARGSRPSAVPRRRRRRRSR